jgi:hypothetical protein
MKFYVIITGAIFALITISHVVRMFIEPHVLTEPIWLLLTLISAALAIWAVVVLRRLNR